MVNKIKRGGRVQGTPNIMTKEMREILKDVISIELDKIQETLNKLEPEKRLELVIKLLPFVIPKVSPINENMLNKINQGPENDYSQWTDEDLRTIVELHEKYNM